MARFCYGLSGRTARYWAHAGIARAPTFHWHRRRQPVRRAVKVRCLTRWFDGITA